jgi:hypothetical protein
MTEKKKTSTSAPPKPAVPPLESRWVRFVFPRRATPEEMAKAIRGLSEQYHRPDA